MRIVLMGFLVMLSTIGCNGLHAATSPLLTTLYSFGGSNGSDPNAIIAVGGVIYGTTANGGAYNIACSSHNCGTVFQLDPTTGAEKVLHSFTSLDGENPTGLTYCNGNLYGATANAGVQSQSGPGQGTVFQYNLATAAFSVLHYFQGGSVDGSLPIGRMVCSGHALYGVTTLGGPFQGSCFCGGTFFKIDLVTGEEKILHKFGGVGDGNSPQSGLLNFHGSIFGATAYGGSIGAGTLFKFDPITKRETILYNFAGGADGGEPVGELVGIGNLLYGTTEFGGVKQCPGPSTYCGTLFTYDLLRGAESVLYAFQGSASKDGWGPNGPLAYINGQLYGTASQGGGTTTPATGGILFRVNATSGREKVLFRFSEQDPSDGVQPEGGVIKLGSLLFGITSSSGSFGGGTLFSYKP